MSNLRKPDVITALVTTTDGGVVVLRIITAEYRPTTQEEKDEGKGDRVVTKSYTPTPKYIESIIDKQKVAWHPSAQPVSWRVVPNDIVNESTDKEYRWAWQDDGVAIVHDMGKAREIHKDKLRHERASRLEALDVEYQRADEQGNNQLKQQIAQQKQVLRDITKDPRIAAAKTIDELKQIVI
jgi:hypothetical protein